MNTTSEEQNVEHESFESSKEHYFLKEDLKGQKSSDDEEDDKDDNEHQQDGNQGNIFATLAALQSGQMTLSQVKIKGILVDYQEYEYEHILQSMLCFLFTKI